MIPAKCVVGSMSNWGRALEDSNRRIGPLHSRPGLWPRLGQAVRASNGHVDDYGLAIIDTSSPSIGTSRLGLPMDTW